MIRDPSDGTVREKLVDENTVKSADENRFDNSINDLIRSTTSGLPITSDPKEIDRLVRSRLWLEQYKGRGR